MSTQLEAEPDIGTDTLPRRRRYWGRFMIVVRRTHLYAGLFLLPWVFLYGITGAMFNHQGLFPEVSIQPVAAERIQETAMVEFPTPAALAQQIVESLQSSVEGKTIELADPHSAAFTNPLQFEAFAGEKRYVASIDPVSKASTVVHHRPNPEEPALLWSDVQDTTLTPDPHDMAQQAAAEILAEVGIVPSKTPQPLGWTKLNFLATVDGMPARVTYILKDRHLEIARYDGNDGMTARRFFLRLHTSHGQPPHWNGRRIWSLFIDAMAIAMVTWGISGVFMWWQIKRTRRVGALVIAASLATAAAMYFSMIHFYATNKL